MLIREDDAATLAFDFTTRNRRPPTDPVNALPSYS
jgi:CRISP-associated protein Cas1